MPPGLQFLVVGDPITHSRSPAIHTAALQALGIEGSYGARRVDASGLEDVFNRLRQGELQGVNVTMPHKALASRMVDELSPEAARCRSVNTVVVEDGRLTGFSTDVTALRRLWKQRAIPSDRPVLLLGAGGAAAAVVGSVAGASLYVAARRAESVGHLGSALGCELVTVPWGAAVADAVVINATPLGMEGERLPDRIVDLATAVVDFAYGEEETPAVKGARAAGLAVIDGLELLAAQAADSFRIWTGRNAPREVMLAAARNRSR